MHCLAFTGLLLNGPKIQSLHATSRNNKTASTAAEAALKATVTSSKQEAVAGNAAATLPLQCDDHPVSTEGASSILEEASEVAKKFSVGGDCAGANAA